MRKLYIESKNRTSWQLNRIKMKVQKLTPINILSIIGYGGSGLLLLLVILSVADVNANNLTTCNYASWNLIRFFL